MSFIDPTIFYIHLPTLRRIIYHNCFKQPSFRRILFTLGFLWLYSLIIIPTIFLRLLDEILFIGYRKTKMEKPVFIVSNPRSGTTYTHRLMCMDKERFTYMLLYHTIFLSITFYKLIQFFGFFDKKMGRPFYRLFNKLDDLFFGGWKDIHPMGFNQSEEDEGVYFMSLTSAAVPLICPYYEHFRYLKIPDRWKPKEKEKMMRFYRNCMQRFYYAHGNGKTLLSKNVMSTGRLKLLLQTFPDARIIFLIRTPYKTVPSLVSMFSAPWKLYSPEIEENSPEYREWASLAMDYYKYFQEVKGEIAKENFLVVPYEELTEQPAKTIQKVYDHFGMKMSKDFEEALGAITVRSKTYKSSHKYSLEQYGLNKEMIYNELKPIFDTYKIPTEL